MLKVACIFIACIYKTVHVQCIDFFDSCVESKAYDCIICSSS